jgi:acylphosphatase
MTKRLHAIFIGNVVGVGFRFTTMEIAHAVGGIVGWVRNTPQGDVELIAEGEAGKLQELLDRTKKAFKKNILDSIVTWEEPIGEFKNFKIWNGPIRD